MKTPLVSVIIPCYNAEKYVKEAIHSIVNQIYKNLEIILIDDGSEDSTFSICEEIKTIDNRIKLIKNEQNLGLIKTLNKGIKLASGEYIARMDADDVSHLERIEKQIAFFTKNPTIGVIGTNAVAIDLNGKQLKTKETAIYCQSNTISFSCLFSQPLVHGSVMAKSSILKSNPYSLDFKHSEDFELWNRLVAQGVKIANLNNRLYYYRNNPNGVSNQHTAEQNLNHNRASKKYIKERFNYELDLSTIELLNNRPSQKVKNRDIKTTLKHFNDLVKSYQLQSEELNYYIEKQKVDILIQAIKKSANFINLSLNFILLVSKVKSKIARKFLLVKFTN